MIVRIHLTPTLALRNRTQKKFEADRGPARAINGSDLESRERLNALLRSLTRGHDEGEVVEAVMFEPDLDALYEVLDIITRPPDLIPVELPPA